MKPSARTVLVTGGTGFIGRHLVRRLQRSRRPEAVVCLVGPKRQADDPTLERFRAAGIRVIEGDLNDPAVSREAPPSVTHVFHLAANVDTAALEADLRVNDVGTSHLLDWLKPVSRGVRVVHASSVAVLDRMAPAEAPLTEKSPCTPRTLYGVTKLRAERIIQARATTDGYTYTIVRLGTIFGSGAKPGGLFESLTRLTARHAVLSRLDWPGRVSVMHVDDVAGLMVSVARMPRAENEIYCAANPYAPTVGELAQHIGRLSGHPIRPLPVPNWLWRSARRITWNPVIRLIGMSMASQTFWRFSLIVDNGLWLDTTKMQSIWLHAPLDLDSGLMRMLETAEELSRFL